MSSRGATQRSSAPFNRRIVLDVVRRRGSISRRDIIELVALSPQTVANITQDLESLGLITATRLKELKSRGQPPIAYSLNPRGGDSIGISLEPTRMSAALVNLAGQVLHRAEKDVDTRDQKAVTKSMIEFVKELSGRSADAPKIWGIGVALPGPWDVPAMSFVGPTAFEGWTDLAIFDRVQRETGLPVFHNTDSVAAALGEMLFGAAQDLDSFYYMHFGIGLGGTLVMNRAAMGGEAGNATELGHIPIVADGTPCYCGNRGCLERYLSLHSLSEAMGLEVGHELGRQEIAALIESGNSKFEEWCEQAAGHLRRAVCTIENMLDPATVLIGGTAPHELLEHLVAKALPLAPSVRADVDASAKRLTLSTLEEGSSILGAAVLPIHEMLSPRFDLLLHERQHRLDVKALLGSPKSTRASLGRL